MSVWKSFVVETLYLILSTIVRLALTTTFGVLSLYWAIMDLVPGRSGDLTRLCFNVSWFALMLYALSCVCSIRQFEKLKKKLNSQKSE